jgi:hypothetical protein
VVLSSPDHIALVMYGLFNVSIPQNQLPKNWKYKEEESHWVDAEHNAIEGDVEFEVTQYGAKVVTGRLMGRLITTGSILSMLGSLKHLQHLSS